MDVTCALEAAQAGLSMFGGKNILLEAKLKILLKILFYFNSKSAVSTKSLEILPLSTQPFTGKSFIRYQSINITIIGFYQILINHILQKALHMERTCKKKMAECFINFFSENQKESC